MSCMGSNNSLIEVNGKLYKCLLNILTVYAQINSNPISLPIYENKAKIRIVLQWKVWSEPYEGI